MFETMLTIEELSAMDELSAYTLYDAEIKRLHRITRAEAPALVERARQGDEGARNELVLGCVRFALIVAHQYYNERQPEHIDVLDLVQEANLAMLAKLDYALRANDPISYLTTLAARAVRFYCTYHAPMIQRPEYSLKEMALSNPYPATVESFNTTIYDDGLRLRIEHIEAPALRLEADEAIEECEQYRFAPLYEAIKHRLTPQQRATIIRQFGLFGQPAEAYSEIAESSHLSCETVRGTAYLARKRLQAILAEHLSEMLMPKPASEEE